MDNSSEDKKGSFGANILQSFREGSRPKFLGGKSEGGDAPAGLKATDTKAADKKSAAASGLKSAESAAADSGFKNSVGGLAGTRQAESKTGGFFTGGGKSDKKKDNKASIISGLKNGSPIIAILGVIVAFMALTGGAQTLMPIAIQEMVVEKFNSVGVSSTVASDSWLDDQLNQGVRQENLRAGDTDKRFAFSKHQVDQFKQHNILVVETAGDPSIAALVYQKNPKKYVPVVGSKFIDTPNLSYSIKVAGNIDGEVMSPISAKEALNDPAFKNPYTAASKTWRGGSSGWFDQIMKTLTQTKLSITRNRWTNFVTSSVKDINNKLSEEYKKFKEAADGTTLNKVKDDGEETVMDDGNGNFQEEPDSDDIPVVSNDDDPVTGAPVPTGETVSDSGSTSLTDGISEATDSDGNVVRTMNEEALKSSLTTRAIKIGTLAASATCGAIEALLSMYTVVAAYQNLQFLNLVTGFLESVDKAKAGDDKSTPVNIYSTNLTTTADVKDDNGSVVRSNTTAMESEGMANLFSNTKVDKNDASVRNVNFETIMSNTSSLFKHIGTLQSTFEYCGYVKAGAAVVDLATTVISFIPLFGQGIKAFQISWKVVQKVAIRAAIMAMLVVAVPIVVKNLTKLAIKNAATEWFGEDLGNAHMSGFNKYLGGNGTSGGQSPGSEKKILAYLGVRDSVIAEEAKYQRSIRSPFDFTSKHTFLGSLVYSAMPYIYSGRNLASIVSSIPNLTSSALVAISPTAHAASNDSLMSKGSCALLETTGAIGDAFCNPIIITDMSTMGMSAVDIHEIVHHMNSDSEIASTNMKAGINESENFESNGSIKPGSPLSKYATYCGQRTAQLGMHDATIADSIGSSSNSTVNSTMKIIGKTPVLSNITQAYEGIKQSGNYEWINGSACVASEESNEWQNQYRYFQRYMENERLLENMNPGYKSPITAFYEDQLEKNPLDQSFEGQLARFSGLSKAEVSDTLALIEYYQFLDEYNPSTRYAFGAPAVEPSTEIKFDNEHTLASIPTLLNQIVYADVRNRNFVV